MSDAETILADVDHWDQAFARQQGMDPQLAALAEAQKDEVLADWIRTTGDPIAARDWLANVRALAEAGEAYDAARLLERFHNHRILLGNVLARHLAAKAANQSAQAKRAGAASKRRQWAEVIAAHLSGDTKEARWASIPQSFEATTVENWGADLEFYRDGDTLCCRVDGAEQRLAKRTFFARYLKRDTVTPLV